MDGSNRAKSIWEQAGEALGLLSDSAGSGRSFSGTGSDSENTGGSTVYQIYYSPVYQGADEAAMRRVSEEGYRDFQEYMARYAKDNRRLSFR